MKPKKKKIGSVKLVTIVTAINALLYMGAKNGTVGPIGIIICTSLLVYTVALFGWKKYKKHQRNNDNF